MCLHRSFSSWFKVSLRYLLLTAGIELLSHIGFGQFHNESEVGYWTGLLGEPLSRLCLLDHISWSAALWSC